MRLDGSMRALFGVVQDYPWGSTTAIPELLGQEPTGEPAAELWFGAHRSAPAVFDDGSTLLDLVTTDPQLLGRDSLGQFGDRLPFLLKVLAAAQPLSLQAHPTRAQAEAGFARENAAGPELGTPARNYADDWPKPEMIVALTEFDALCGFAQPEPRAELWREFDQPALAPLIDRLAAGDLRDPLTSLLSEAQWREVATEVLARCADPSGLSPAAAALAATAVQIDAFHPGDPGILVALMMNRVRLAPGEALFLPAGNLHAYLEGTGVEIMANSDNVLRGGLTSKHVDVAELGSVLEFTPTDVALVPVDQISPGIERYRTPAPEFALHRISAGAGTLPGLDTARVLLVTSGELRAARSDDQLDIASGRALFLAAGEDVSVSGDGVGWLASVG